MFFPDLTKFLNPQPERVEVRHPVTGELHMVLHSKGGLAHRDDGPAQIFYHNGQAWAQEWYQNGKIHRADGPARMYLKHPRPELLIGKAAKDANGERIAEWHLNGQFQAGYILDHNTFHQHWHKGE